MNALPWMAARPRTDRSALTFAVLWLMLALLSMLARPAEAQQSMFKFSVGYSYLKILETGGGSEPLGGYLSVVSGRQSTGVELDLAYHRDRETFFTQTITLNTLTATLGPRWTGASTSVRPYIHMLGGIRYDWLQGGSNTSFGGLAGAGVEIPTSGKLFLRLGADFEIFFDEGDNLKALRLSAGIGF